MNIADVVVLILIAVFVIIGIKKGLMLSILSIGSYFIAILLAVKLAAPVAKILVKISVFASIKGKVSDFINGLIKDIINDSVDTQIDGIVDKLKLSENLQSKLGIDSLRETSSTTAGMVDTLSGKIADLILLVIAFVVVYILAKIALRIISKLIRKTSKLPVIRTFDKLGGALFGMLEGVLIIWIIYMVLFMFRASGFTASIFELINKSKVALFLYKNNVLMGLVSGYLAKLI